jgi:hypothetical protein
MPVYTVRVTTTGSAGSASATALTTIPVNGLITAIKIDYHASAPVTTDVVIAETGLFSRTLLTVSNNKTDNNYYPGYAQVDAAATALTAYALPNVSGEYVSIAVAQCDALTDAVVVHIQTLR